MGGAAELAKALTGFRHDEDIQGPEKARIAFSNLLSVAKKSLLARLVTMFKGSSKSSVLILLVFGILLLPVLLAGALIVVPFIWMRRLIRDIAQKRKEKRFLERMVLAGRTIEWSDVQRELSQGRGSLILENHSFKGLWRLWWAPHAVTKESPFPYATSKEEALRDFEFKFVPFSSWCYEKYTNPGSGEAMLVKSADKALRRELEAYEYIKFFRLAAAKSGAQGLSNQ